MATKVAAPTTTLRVVNIVKVETNTVGGGVGTMVGDWLGAGLGINERVGTGAGI